MKGITRQQAEQAAIKVSAQYPKHVILVAEKVSFTEGEEMQPIENRYFAITSDSYNRNPLKYRVWGAYKAGKKKKRY